MSVLCVCRWAKSNILTPNTHIKLAARPSIEAHRDGFGEI